MDVMAGNMDKKKYVIHPAKFSMWLFIVSIILFFGGLTSAYIVSKGIEAEHDTWYTFQLPPILWYNSIVLIVSSVMIQIGIGSARKGDFSRTKIAFLLTLALGLLFLIGQFLAYEALYDDGVVFGQAGSKAGNYLYVLTFMHGLHILAGLIFLAVVTVRLYRNKYTQDNLVGVENCGVFWHFLDLLWIYLFIFLLINHG